MKTAASIFLIAALCILGCKAVDEIVGNLAFYGRGQRHFPNYWNEIKDTKGTPGIKIYFPFSDIDNSTTTTVSDQVTTTTVKTNETPQPIIDTAKNHPLVLYLPGKKKEEYSYLNFYITPEDGSVNLSSYHKYKTEIKLVVPPKDQLIAEGYTCKNIGLDCTSLKDYNFDEHSDEWLSKVNIKLFLQPRGAREEEGMTEEDILEYDYEMPFDKPTNKWKECHGDIIKTKFVDTSTFTYTDFIIRNYGTMPVYIHVGNSIFLRKDSTYMVKEGVTLNNFKNWSWHKPGPNINTTYFENEYYADEKDNKGVKLVGITDGDSAYYVHLDSGISAPPEGISFRLRPLNDNQFKFKLDNKKEFNLTYYYLLHRNCKIPIGEESNVLIDVRSLVYSDPKFMLMNDISGFWVMSISRINEIKEKLYNDTIDANKGENGEIGEKYAKAYADKLFQNYRDVYYFYDFVLHHTYPTEEEIKSANYVNIPLDPSKGNCNLSFETHDDWGDINKRNDALPVIQWPDDVELEDVIISKNSLITEIPDSEKNSGEEETQEGGKSDDTGDAYNPYSIMKPLITVCLITTLFAFLI